MRKIKTPLDDIGAHQTYNDGTMKLYRKTNTAEPGMRPVYKPELLYNRIPFEIRTAGIQRQYYAKQEGYETECVYRIPGRYEAAVGDDVVIKGSRYVITSAQNVTNVYPTAIDLTITDETEDIQ